MARSVRARSLPRERRVKISRSRVVEPSRPVESRICDIVWLRKSPNSFCRGGGGVRSRLSAGEIVKPRVKYGGRSREFEA